MYKYIYGRGVDTDAGHNYLADRRISPTIYMFFLIMYCPCTAEKLACSAATFCSSYTLEGASYRARSVPPSTSKVPPT